MIRYDPGQTTLARPYPLKGVCHWSFLRLLHSLPRYCGIMLSARDSAGTVSVSGCYIGHPAPHFFLSIEMAYEDANVNDMKKWLIGPVAYI